MKSKFKLDDNSLFIILIVIAAIINLGVIAFMDLESSRLTRLVTIVLLFCYYLFKKEKINLWTVVAFVFFISRDVFFQFYEEAWGYKTYLILGTLCYLTIVLERLPKISEINFKPGVVLVTLFLVAANTYTPLA